VISFATALFSAGLGAPANDGSIEFLGFAREISRGWSASRDTPAMTMTIFARPGVMGGGELSFLAVRFPDFTLRNGFAGFIELEHDSETSSVNSGPMPSGEGKILWRGSYAYQAAFALDTLGRRLCPDCALELTLQYRHESQHYTGSNNGDGGLEDVSVQPYVGDAVIGDVASSQRFGSWYFAERLLGMWYLPERSSYDAGFGADLHARWLVFPRAHPFVSLYGEQRFGGELIGRRYPDAYRLRAFAGIALPSWLGDVQVYASADVGHRYGVRILTEEATLGLGVRLALGTLP
jgi:hypothetical protein